jgi:hypothetical protein
MKATMHLQAMDGLENFEFGYNFEYCASADRKKKCCKKYKKKGKYCGGCPNK